MKQVEVVRFSTAIGAVRQSLPSYCLYIIPETFLQLTHFSCTHTYYCREFDNGIFIYEGPVEEDNLIRKVCNMTDEVFETVGAVMGVTFVSQASGYRGFMAEYLES